jgi:hypothetical protein
MGKQSLTSPRTLFIGSFLSPVLFFSVQLYWPHYWRTYIRWLLGLKKWRCNLLNKGRQHRNLSCSRSHGCPDMSWWIKACQRRIFDFWVFLVMSCIPLLHARILWFLFTYISLFLMWGIHKITYWWNIRHILLHCYLLLFMMHMSLFPKL